LLKRRPSFCPHCPPKSSDATRDTNESWASWSVCCINLRHVSGDTKSSIVNMSGSVDNCLSALIRRCFCCSVDVDTGAVDDAANGTSALVAVFDFSLLDPQNPLPLLRRLLPRLRFFFFFVA